MNLILHQFKTDARHFRWRLVILWLSFAAEPLLMGIHSMQGVGVEIAHFLIEVWQALFSLALIVSLVQADAFVGTGAAWLTRPVRRRHLLWAKTLFILVCLFLPRFVLQCLGWEWCGYSLHLTVAAVEESLLFSVTFVLVVAVLASLTRDAARFFLAAGIMVGGIFAGVVVVEMLVHARLLHQAAQGWPNEHERGASARTVAWLVLMAGAGAAWIFQVGMGRRQAAICLIAAVLLAFPIITTVWSKNFLAPKLTPTVPLTVSLVGTNRPASAIEGQFLTPELVVAGVPARHVAVTQDISAKIKFNGQRKSTPLHPVRFTSYQRRIRPAGSQQQNNYFQIIQGFFPSSTLWFNDDFGGGVGGTIFDQDILKRFPNGPPAGTLDGEATVDLYGVRKVAEEPLQFATFNALPGLRVTVQKVRLANGVITVLLDECVAQLDFDRDVNTRGQDYFNGGRPYCSYVLYHPGSGEAFVVPQNNARNFFPSLLGGESHMSLELSFPYPALRERLAGVSAEDWLREARLCVFAPVYEGTSRLEFHQENYRESDAYAGNGRRQTEKLNKIQAIDHTALPAHPTAAQLDTYLDKILLNMSDNWNGSLRNTIENKLVAIGAKGLPALLRRLPLGQNAENIVVFPAIVRLVTRDQLPDLRAALQRDNNVVTLFLEKNWEADARDVLVAKLADHRQPLPAEALRIAAEAKDPATYADLRWHFVHLDYGHDRVLAALAQCPGFDIGAAVSEAWQSARLGVISPGDLAASAAKQGLPDALNLAVLNVENANDPDGQQRKLAQLASLTGYDGTAGKTLPWLTANLGRFRYDAAQQRYILEPGR